MDIDFPCLVNPYVATLISAVIVPDVFLQKLCLLFDVEQVTEKKFDNLVEWGIDLASEHER